MIACIISFVMGMLYGMYGGMKYKELRDPELMEAQRRARLQILSQKRAEL